LELSPPKLFHLDKCEYTWKVYFEYDLVESMTIRQ
jgi:hypothetical protein